MRYAFWGTSHAVSHILSSQSVIKPCLVIALFFHAALQLTPAYLVTEDTFLPWRFSPRLHTASQRWSQVPACWQFFLSSPYSGSCTSPFNLTTHLFCQRTFIRDLVLWDGLYSGFLWSNEFGKCCTLLNLEDVCVCVCVCEPLSHVRFFVTQRTVALQAPLSMEFPGKNTGMGCHSRLQGIFPTQESNPSPESPTLQADSLPSELPQKTCADPSVPGNVYRSH